MLLNPIAAPSAPFTRITEDAYGAVTSTSLGSCPVVVSIGAAAPADSTGPGVRQVGVVFTPRDGVVRREGDRFTYNGETYELIGHPRGDQLQPFTGDDFGWVQHAFRRATL